MITFIADPEQNLLVHRIKIPVHVVCRSGSGSEGFIQPVGLVEFKSQTEPGHPPLLCTG